MMLDFQQCAGQPPTLDFSASVANVGLPWWLSGQRNQPALQETQVQSLGPEDPLEGGHGNLLQYACLEHPVGRGAWWATVREFARESDTTEQ